MIFAEVEGEEADDAEDDDGAKELGEFDEDEGGGGPGGGLVFEAGFGHFCVSFRGGCGWGDGDE